MRHGHTKARLPLPASHAASVLRNLASSLIVHGRIETTVKRAKVLRPFVEKLITKCKTFASSPDYSIRDFNYRLVLSTLRHKEAVQVATRVWGAYYLTRPGGYTRILKAGFRKGDNAEMAIIEFVLNNGSEKKAQYGDALAHANELAKASDYGPKGIKYLRLWRAVGLPHVDMTVSKSDVDNGVVHFKVTATVRKSQSENDTIVAWPTFRGLNLPLNLSLHVAAPRDAKVVTYGPDIRDPLGEEREKYPAKLQRVDFSLSPEKPSISFDGKVLLSETAPRDRYCLLAIDGPTGELFHARVI